MKTKAHHLLMAAALTGLAAGCATKPTQTNAGACSAAKTCSAKGSCASKGDCAAKGGCSCSAGPSKKKSN